LRVGQELLAEVLSADADTGQALLSLAGRHVTAQVPPGLEEGQVLRLAVAQIGAERLVLRLAGASRQTMGETTASDAGHPLDPAVLLAELDLPNTPELRAAVHALVARGQPLAREALLAVRSAFAGQPGDAAENAQAALDLLLHDLPVTPRSLVLARTALTQPPVGDLLRDLVAAATVSDGAEATASLAPGTLPAAEGQRVPAVPTGAPGAITATGTLPPALPGATSPTIPLPAALPPESAPPAVPPTPGQSRSDASPATVPASVTSALSEVGGQPPLARTILTLAVSTPTAADLQRVVQLIAEGPEAKLVQAVESDAPPSAAPDSDPPLPADGPEASPLPLPPREIGPDARTLLAAIAERATSTDARAGDSRQPGEGDSLEPSTAAEGRSATVAGGGELSTAPRSPGLATAIQTLAGALHDKIEMQQLVNATTLAREGRSLPAPTGTAIDAVEGVIAPGRSPGQLAGGFVAPSQAPALTSDLPQPLLFSLPLAFAGQLATLELAVQREAPQRGRTGPSVAAAAPVRAQFSLQLDRLGRVGADVRLDGGNVRCRLSAELESTQQVLREGLGDLESRLTAAGFAVTSLDCTSIPRQSDTPLSLRRVDLGA
jgi:hypothetical protein